jgi:hypothetical protein
MSTPIKLEWRNGARLQPAAPVMYYRAPCHTGRRYRYVVRLFTGYRVYALGSWHNCRAAQPARIIVRGAQA